MGLNSAGTVGTVVTLASIAVIAYVVLLAIYVLSVRLEIHPGQVHIVAGPMRRRHALASQPPISQRVTPRKAFFSATLGAFGIEVGAGRDANGDPVEVLRLAPGPTVVVISCQTGRLAVVPTSPAALLAAVNAAMSDENQRPRSSR